MLKVYDKNETNFNSNGLAILEQAENICISREINGEYRLTFDLSGDNEKWQYLQQRNKVVCEGQQFRIYRKSREKQGDIKRTVECLHVIFDASQKLIPDFPDQIGYTPRSILVNAFTNTQFNIMSEQEVTALGMSWVTEKTDIFECSKTTPLEIVKKVIENVGKGELYIDNYNIAIVNRIGKDTGIRLTLSNNLQSLNDVEDSEGVVTRLYPLGKDGMSPSSTVAPYGYIDSVDGIAKYGIIEGYRDYDTEDPNELYQKALWEFSPDNPDRIDMASVAYTIQLIELYKLYGNNYKINIGDSAFISNKVLDIETSQRIVKYTYFPYSPDQSTVVLGKPLKTLSDIIKTGLQTSKQINNVTNQAGEIKSTWLENIVRNLKQKVYDGLKRELTLHKTGDLWEFENNTAIAIVDGVLAIANERDADGNWKFKTFGNGDGFVADLITAGVLKGIEIQQISDVGNLLLSMYKDTNGGKVAIYDNQGNLNLKMGVEGTGGDNVGGTLILYNDDIMKKRVALGTRGLYDSGFMILYGTNNMPKAYIAADQGIFLYDDNGQVMSSLTAYNGTINGKNIATTDYVDNAIAQYLAR
jgi:phage minor structural protein